jgi:hypothetical protein
MRTLSRRCRSLLVVPLVLAGLHVRADCPGSARLEEALVLVSTVHPVLIAEGSAHAETQKQHDWKAVLSRGYDTNTTFETGEAGGRAALRVEIPLWDRANQIEKAKAHATLVAKEDNARVSLLGDIQSLCELSSQVKALDTLRIFTRDRLEYRQERVTQGLDPAESLWREAESMQRAEHDWQRESGKLDALRLTLARGYGGEEWSRLQALLTAMTN